MRHRLHNTGERTNHPVVIVGAGLAGLVCARQLARAGLQVVVVEQEATVGGRVRTLVTPDGYRLDRGFQVIFAAYPALRRHVRLDALSPRYFSSSTTVVRDGQMRTAGHPLYAPLTLLATLRSGLFRRQDVIALSGLLWQSRSFGDSALTTEDLSTTQALQRAGVSHAFIENIAIPFYGGVSLDRSLSSDASFFGLVLRSLAVGRSFVPAAGVQHLPELLAQQLPAGTVRLDSAVLRLLMQGDMVTGVQTNGAEIEARAVVLATEAPVAAALTGKDLPAGKRSNTTVYLSSDRPLYAGRQTVVHAGDSLVNEVVQLTNVAPEYAPPGRHLLSASVLHLMEGSDDSIAQSVVQDLYSWFPGARRVQFEPVGVVRVPYAQFAQPPGIYGRLPRSETSTPGLFLAGEYLHSSSIQGAMRSGELAAGAVLRQQ